MSLPGLPVACLSALLAVGALPLRIAPAGDAGAARAAAWSTPKAPTPSPRLPGEGPRWDGGWGIIISDCDPRNGDLDGDEIGDRCDNCRVTPNADQADRDADLRGDACDSCPDAFDPGGADSDRDGVGDACDPE